MSRTSTPLQMSLNSRFHRRRKITHESDSNAWSQSSSRFGEKILQNQGWKPGTFLGPPNAPHVSFHTPANASYIRVSAKDDTLGLGATGSSASASRGPTGLDSLQHLFGRLNGKTEAKLEAEQQSRNNLACRYYVNRRWGSLHFVSAGLLQKDAPPVDPMLKKAISAVQSSEIIKQEQQPLGVPDAKPEDRLDRCVLSTKHEEPGSVQDAEIDVKERRTNEKAQRRQERAKRKEAKKLRRFNQRQHEMEPSQQALVAPIDTEDVPKANSTAHLNNTRHCATRFRYIQQKKMAIADVKALNEVSQISLVYLGAYEPILTIFRYSCYEHEQVAITIRRFPREV